MAEVKIVLVGGGTASGKSTLVSAFVAKTGALHVSHDRYYLNAKEPAKHDFDHPDALETSLLVEQLHALKRGESVDLPRYDFATHRRGAEVDRVQADGLVVVEGILVFAAPMLEAVADLTVFVDAPEPLRLARRIRRDMAERGRSRADVLRQYAATVGPAHGRFVQPALQRADLVLDGTASIADSVDRLMAVL
jgi:uridine kinase